MHILFFSEPLESKLQTSYLYIAVNILAHALVSPLEVLYGFLEVHRSQLKPALNVPSETQLFPTVTMGPILSLRRSQHHYLPSQAPSQTHPVVCTEFCPCLLITTLGVSPGKGIGNGGLGTQYSFLASRAPEQHLPGAEKLGSLLHLLIFSWNPLVSWKPVFPWNPCFPKSHLPHHFSPILQPLPILPSVFRSLTTLPRLSTCVLPQCRPVPRPSLSFSAELSPPFSTCLLSRLLPGHSYSSFLSPLPLHFSPPLHHSSPSPLSG